MAKKKRGKLNKVSKSSKYSKSKKFSAIKHEKKSNTWMVFVFLGLVIFSVALNVFQTTGKAVAVTGYVEMAEPGQTAGTGTTTGGTTDTSSVTTLENFFQTTGGKVLAVFIGNPVKNPEKINSFLSKDMLFGQTGIIIIHVTIWLILFFSFSYALAIFLFTKKKMKWIAWVVGFGMAVITANFGVVTMIVGWMAAVTGALGAFAVFASIGFAFVAFFLVNLFANLGRIHKASQAAQRAHAGGTRLAGGVKGLGKITGALEEQSYSYGEDSL